MIRPHLHFHLGSLLPHHLTRAVKRLFESTAILGVAVAAVTLFEPIYLFTLGYSLRAIVVFYVAVYVLYFFLAHLGANFAARHGYERSILLGSLLFIPYYAALFAIPLAPWLVFGAPLLFALQKAFYWPAFHADFSRFATTGEVSREIGEASLVVTMASIIGPVLGGVIIAGFGFAALFTIVIVLVFVSNLPLLRSRPTRSPSRFSSRVTLRRLVSPGHRRAAFSFAGYGEELVAMVLWPVFLFTLFGGALAMGALMTAASLIVSLALLFVGRYADMHRRIPLIHFGAAAVAVTSVLRTAVISAPIFLFVESGYRMSRGALDLPLLSELYTRARAGDPLIETTFFEMSLAAGKVVIGLLLLVVLSLARSPWFTVFLLAGVFALLFALFPGRERPIR